MKTASAKSGRKAITSSSRLPAVGSRKILKASWHLVGGRTHVDIRDGRFIGLDLKLGGGRFAGLGLQTGGASGRWRLWKARGVEAKQSREGGMSVRGSNKKLDSFTPQSYKDYELRIRIFYIFVIFTYTWKKGCERLFVRVWERGVFFCLIIFHPNFECC